MFFKGFLHLGAQFAILSRSFSSKPVRKT